MSRGINTTPAARLDVTARTTINGSSTLNATAQLSPSGGDVAAHVDLAQFDLAMLQPFIAQRTAMTLQSGRLATQLDIKKAADGTLSVKGDVGVAGLKTVDELKQSFIKWKDLRVAGIDYNSQPASLQIASITAHEPYARVIIAPDRTVNVQVVLAGPSKGGPSLATQLGDANAKAGGVTVAGVKGGSPAAQAAVADIKAKAAGATATAADASGKAADATAGAERNARLPMRPPQRRTPMPRLPMRRRSVERNAKLPMQLPQQRTLTPKPPTPPRRYPPPPRMPRLTSQAQAPPRPPRQQMPTPNLPTRRRPHLPRRRTPMRTVATQAPPVRAHVVHASRDLPRPGRLPHPHSLPPPSCRWPSVPCGSSTAQ